MFTVTSEDVIEGATAAPLLVYDKGSCNGRDCSPQLSWAGAPEGTQSYAITLHDPDAPRNGGWWHWVVFNIPATVHSLPTAAGSADGKALPPGAIQLVNDYGERGYGGPCPPAGHAAHHYILTIHALRVPTLGARAQDTPAVVERTILSEELGKAVLTFRYGH
jgi:Raf kinase inhibitor-like YbhB/YbcL family protein